MIDSRENGRRAWDWSPDGKTFAVGTAETTAAFYQADSGEWLQPLTNPHKPTRFSAVAWSPDGKFLASGGPDAGTINLWDTRSGACRLLGERLTRIEALAWSPDGKTLAAAPGCAGQVELWNAADQTCRILPQMPFVVYRLAWSPLGKDLAVGGSGGDYGVEIWDAESGQRRMQSGKVKDVVSALAWSPDGKVVAFGGGGGNDTVDLWDVESGKRTQLPTGRTSGLAWTLDGKTLVTASEDGHIRLWDATTAKNSRDLTAFPGRHVAWSPDGKTLASVGYGALTLWEAGTYTPRTIGGDGQPLGWSHDSRIVAAGGERGTVELRERESGRLRATLFSLEGSHWLALSPEGHYRGSAGVEQQLQVVVQTEKGQQTLTVEQFEKRYGWKNNPERVRLSGE
jgi:WD40 repeat protein